VNKRITINRDLFNEYKRRFLDYNADFTLIEWGDNFASWYNADIPLSVLFFRGNFNPNFMTINQNEKDFFYFLLKNT
jgi:hypothetical protein